MDFCGRLGTSLWTFHFGRTATLGRRANEQNELASKRRTDGADIDPTTNGIGRTKRLFQRRFAVKTFSVKVADLGLKRG